MLNRFHNLKKIAILFGLLCFFSPTHADLENLVIIEGVGISDVITLGMNREEIKDIAQNGNCDTGKKCSFRLTNDSAALTVTFNKKHSVKKIEINQVGSPIQWLTASGVHDQMSLDEAAKIYPQSKISKNKLKVNHLGYTYETKRTCIYSQFCSRKSRHYIYKPR